MNQEYESETGWKQLGSLANSVLRNVMEKRKLQAEMTNAAPVEAALPPAQSEFGVQLDLPLFSSAVHASQARPRPGVHRL